MLTGYLSLGCRPGGERANTWLWTSRFAFFFQNRKQQPQLLPHFLPYSIPQALIRNLIIIMCINYRVIICINDNNSVIDNNYERLQDLLLLFKIPMGKRMDFFQIYRKFERASSKRCARPDIG